MASADKDKKRTRKVSFTYLKRLFSGVALICFFVMIAAGVMADNRWVTITERCFVVMVVIMLINWVVVKILASYEEMNNSGKA